MIVQKLYYLYTLSVLDSLCGTREGLEKFPKLLLSSPIKKPAIGRFFDGAGEESRTPVSTLAR